MAIRVPRGFAVDRPYYQEISKGERLSVSEIPLEAYTGLPHVRVDQLHHDPVVLEPGTLVGLPTGGPASGFLTPAHHNSGFVAGNTTTTALGRVADVILTNGSTEGRTEWGLPTAESGQLTVASVKPIGVIYQPIYSFVLQSLYTNYKRNDNVGVLTNYVIQIPVSNFEEDLITDGDLVMLGTGQHHGIGWTSPWRLHLSAGRYMRYDSTLDLSLERIVGRCLHRLHLGATSSAAGTTLLAAITASTFTISPQAAKAFKGLAKVQTVPGLSLTGSGTAGIPGWLLGARSNGGSFAALTILIRL